ncbi:DUF2971 domain-containing protein [Photobacterium damselae]|uniref:DUF2971 domain-containing protein n=1 Tax=Photobacterium damselae TaxID=38293 RepID=UPI000D060B68|nr:DUF2971 domain-containing protein [Photobacterium damselae]PSB78092.1 hypothetical protein C5F62_18555 [Photobacterium damselae subsp. damselae]UKA30459.1 DUF2971 domain-containing protein [Photobacterium damselae subsp. damselae]
MNHRNIRCFKFRGGNENDLDSLFDNYVWFSSLSSLNDPYEGYVTLCNDGISDDFRERYLTSVFSREPKLDVSPDIEAKNYRKNYEKDTGTSFADYVDNKTSKIIEAYYKEHKNDFKILSLSLAKDNHEHPAPLNNMLMWAHYANGFKGFCIEFDFEKLKQSIEVKNNVQLSTSQVKYATDGKLPIIQMKTFMKSTINDSHDSSVEIIEAFTKKEQSWAYENEVRFISDRGGKLYYAPECIKAIYISEKTPNWLKNNLISNVSIKLSNIKVYLVFLHPREYKFGFRKIEI